MYFQVTNLQNTTKDMFRDKQTTNKVPLIFLDVTALTRKRTIVLLGTVNKQTS